jgi:hypothetical protein
MNYLIHFHLIDEIHSSLYLRESARDSLLDNEPHGSFRGNFLEFKLPQTI